MVQDTYNAPEDSISSTSSTLGRGDDEPCSLSMGETWNNPPINKVRLPTMFLAYMMMGLCNSGIGALLPYVQEEYKINYTIVSLLFFFQVLGYLVSAGTINLLYRKIGVWGVGLLSCSCYLFAFTALALHPPFPVMVIGMATTGFGGGLGDAAWNGYIGKLEYANGFLGVLHGSYGVGAIITPLIATSMVENGHLKWYYFYYIALALEVLATLSVLLSFRSETAAKYRTQLSASTDTASEKARSGTREIFRYRTTWLIGFFMLGYMFVEVSIGGWIITYMRIYRSGAALPSSFVASGFWFGLTTGAFTLSWIATPRTMPIFFLLSIAAELILWRVNNFHVSAVAVALLGFFYGPQFPTAILQLTKLLPTRCHGPAIAVCSAFGSAGGSVGPFIIGAMAQKEGVEVVHPWVLGLLGVQVVTWVALPWEWRGSEKGKTITEAETT